MTTPYQHLALADVKPGMVLSDVLLDPQGKVLLPAGATLTEAIIALLPRHGVAMLPILRPPPSDAEAAARRAAIEQRLARLFRKHDPEQDSEWASAILLRYVEDYRLDREIEQ